ncbi:hypothetical protein F441_00207 [Phytophthora nicotianae CJ01A1]|uniref:Uncharacterized protein n=6 Tax=Phytophthora nicotianae TaxID=4792 RepID=W2RED9_PHYN3|nr:hypothetical protein PPTG_00173 [Phytophthora nicotianae INRA-310]ETK97247.1 hypothetical protein L915_00185 [Phytophthora nicotianae]ETO86228.1 hypothetical protein F444_00207 [Phytophthora nicotianae P1976]ETP27265.1 hypothetical protein F441_00207 [Phytophthora nicotianae CJ01A1]KUF97676.1 hypothetical protein AM588_10009545 [Phytophthora nicotianae]ETL50600.1 hypothetical protein L916_00185 [Phytophthora nicotianae]
MDPTGPPHSEICSVRNKFLSITMTSISPPRRSMSESYKHHYLATLEEDEENPACSVPLPNEPVDDHHPLMLAVDHTGEPLLALQHRSKSESFICTAQGIVFEDARSEYSSKLSNLEALAANNNALGTRSNVLLAKKALRYRKGVGRRRNME